MAHSLLKFQPPMASSIFSLGSLDKRRKGPELTQPISRAHLADWGSMGLVGAMVGLVGALGGV